MNEASICESAVPSGQETASLAECFAWAQALAREGRDDDAKRAFLSVLHRNPTHFGALTDLAGLALASGHRSAAMTAYRQAVASHPDNAFGLVNLANLVFEDGELAEARALYERALARDASLAYAHQGLANVLAKLGDESGAARHAAVGYGGDNCMVARPYRGAGTPLRVLLLVSAKGGNIPTNSLLDDRVFAVTAIYAEHRDPRRPLPAHDVVFNAIGDADLCADALEAVTRIEAESTAPVVNRSVLIRGTGRCDNARRLAGLADVVAPRTLRVARSALEGHDAPELLAAAGLRFPLLLRAPGFHTGQYFLRVESEEELPAALEQLPGTELFAIEYLDARGRDGMARKFRVMIIDGHFYPLHLALSKSWKVHYFTSNMADHVDYRSEEEAFLTDMTGALGPRAVCGLKNLRDALGFDYGGVDFAVAPDGRLLLFEANATMAIVPPAVDAIWDYRREPVARAVEAARAMLFARANTGVTRMA
jgi:glutathione synthase/RimK-type ligase-like ATP-grasp enzyme